MPVPLRVLLVVEQFNRRGSGGLAALHLATVLSRHSIDVRVCAQSSLEWGTITPREKALFGLTLCGGSGPTRHLVPGDDVRIFREVLDHFRPDVVDLCSLQYAKSRFLISAAKAAGARVVARPWLLDWFCIQGCGFRAGAPCTECTRGTVPAWRHGCGTLRARVGRVGSDALLRRALLNIDAFISTSTDMDAILEDYGVEAGRVVRGAVPYERGHLNGVTPSEGRRFVFNGQHKDFKGVLELPSVARACPTVQFVFRPLGGTASELARFRVETQNLPNVEISEGGDWETWLENGVATSRAVLVPSQYPMSQEYALMEALHLGKPVIVFGVGAHRALVDGQNARVIALGDWRAFAEAVEDLNSNPALRDRLSAGARAAFESLTSDRSLLDSTFQAYQPQER